MNVLNVPRSEGEEKLKDQTRDGQVSESERQKRKINEVDKRGKTKRLMRMRK